MKNYTMFSYEYLFSDYFSNVSNEAKLYYIKLNFFAEYGFVPNPLEILDSLGYDKSVLLELIRSEEVLTLPNRKEVFLTSYFIHNYRFNPFDWNKSPFAVYWKGKLYIKKNGVATFKNNSPHLAKNNHPEMLDNVKERGKKKKSYASYHKQDKSTPAVEVGIAKTMNKASESSKEEDAEWQALLKELENNKDEF